MIENSEYENTTFIVLNVENDGLVTATVEKFNFRFFIVKVDGALDAIVNTKDGYIECSNKRGNFLYIYLGAKKIRLNSNYETQLATNFYFISDRKLDNLSKKEFSFKFSGGIINKVFPPSPPDIKKDTPKQIIINKKNISYNMEMNVLNKRAELQFCSCYCTETNSEKSIITTADDSTLLVKGNFSIKDLFRIEAELSRVFSFMVGRRVINCYKIDLVTNMQVGKSVIQSDVAICYYRTLSGSDGIEINKSYMSVLTIHKLQEKKFKKLYNLINKPYKSHGFNIDFIVAEKKLEMVDKIRVKETVTAIECILNRFNIHCKNKKTKDLIEKLKTEIDNTNDSNIDPDIKIQLKNALKYANYPLKDRVIKLYQKEKLIIDGYLEAQKSNVLNFDFSNIENIIEDIIEYRNKNTHNAIKYIDNSIIKGVILLNAIIYSKVLRQIGFTNKSIKWLLIDCLR